MDSRKGCPPRLITMVHKFLDGMQAPIQNEEEFSEPFEMTTWLLVLVEWESRATFLTIYDDLYKTYLWGICITLNLFVALTSA